MTDKIFPTADEVLAASTQAMMMVELQEAAEQVVAGEMSEDEYYALKAEWTGEDVPASADSGVMNETHHPTRQDIRRAKMLIASHLSHLAPEAMILLTEPYTPCPATIAPTSKFLFGHRIACIIEDWQEGREETDRYATELAHAAIRAAGDAAGEIEPWGN